METKHFLYKLIPPRPSFAMDMSEAEAAAMAEHAQYWRGLLAAGSAVAFGPVVEPSGVWGLAVVEAEDEAAVRAFGERDPAVTSGTATFEVYPMLSAVVRPHVA